MVKKILIWLLILLFPVFVSAATTYSIEDIDDSSSGIGPDADVLFGVAVNRDSKTCKKVTWGDIYNDKYIIDKNSDIFRFSQVQRLKTAAGTCYFDYENSTPETCCSDLGLTYVPAAFPEPTVRSEDFTVCDEGYYLGHTETCSKGDASRVTGTITKKCDYENNQLELVINVDDNTCSVSYSKSNYVEQISYVPGNKLFGEYLNATKPANGLCPDLSPGINPTNTYALTYPDDETTLVSYDGVAAYGTYCDVYDNNDDTKACCDTLISALSNYNPNLNTITNTNTQLTNNSTDKSIQKKNKNHTTLFIIGGVVVIFAVVIGISLIVRRKNNKSEINW